MTGLDWPSPPPAAALLAGRVHGAPTTRSGRLDIVLEADDPPLVYEAVPWTPRPGDSGPLLPTVGARCLVAIDDRGDPWVLAWEEA